MTTQAPPSPRAPRSRSAGLGRAPQPSGLGEHLPARRRQRRPAVAALGVVLVLAFAAISAALVSRSSHAVSVLVAARTVPAGAQLSAGDLRVAQISGSGVAAIAADGEDSVVGETAMSSLPVGTLLTPGMLSRYPVPPVGQQVVAVSLKSGALPAEVTPGRSVSLVSVATAADAKPPTGSPVLVASARVLDVAFDPTTETVVLSVQVAAADAARVAQLASVGGLSVTLLPVSP